MGTRTPYSYKPRTTIQAKTTINLYPDAVKALNDAEDLAGTIHGFRPNHSQAITLATAAWVRELSQRQT